MSDTQWWVRDERHEWLLLGNTPRHYLNQRIAAVRPPAQYRIGETTYPVATDALRPLAGPDPRDWFRDD